MKHTLILLALLLLSSSPADASRTKYATERLELNSYKVWSIADSADGCQSVLVMDPDEYIYHLQVGDYIGRNDGKVSAIDDRGIVVIELRPDGKGGWREQSVRIEMTE